MESVVTTLTSPRAEPTSAVQAALKRNSLGVFAVGYSLLGATGPLLVSAGLITTFFAVTGLVGAAIFFVVVSGVLALFAVGYVAMARRIQNAGAFYAFVRWGLGRPAGVSAAMVAVMAYNMLQVALYGLFGSLMASTLDPYASAPWWAWALLGWALVAGLGLVAAKLSARVLAALSIVEIAVSLAIGTVGLAHPAASGVALGTLSLGNLVKPGLGAAAVTAVLGYVGFEGAPIYGEEARNPRRTVLLATYAVLATVTVVYVLASLAMVSFHGPDQVASVAVQEGPGLFFAMAAAVPWLATVGQLLLITSVFAALLAFHNNAGRYAYSLGRESVLPAVFRRTGARTGAPWVASLTQSGLGLVVIVVFAVTGLDPVVQFFFLGGTTGGFGILVLLAMSSVAVVAYFGRNPQMESAWTRVVAPVVAGLLLIGMVILAVVNFAVLLGPGATPVLAIVLPASFLLPMVAGLARAWYLRARRPEVYAVIGLGHTAVLAGGQR
jgi:amino acid transporter